MARYVDGFVLPIRKRIFRSRAHRDRVNAAVMKDPKMHSSGMTGAMPFDPRRFACGGFDVLVSW